MDALHDASSATQEQQPGRESVGNDLDANVCLFRCDDLVLKSFFAAFLELINVKGANRKKSVSIIWQLLGNK